MSADSEDKHPIALRVQSLPESPGVYLMKDKEGKVIYIGKAKNLKERVRSYFNFQDTRAQIAFLLDRLYFIDTIITENEEQAFVLESDLIKKYQPRYNIKLKDDKAYLSVRVNHEVEWPRLDLVRRIENDGAKYFGPYSSSSELRAVLELIKTVIPLRSCSDTVFLNRQRPCLEYEIKRCAGPCCLPVDKGEYQRWIRQAERILEGRSQEVKEEIVSKMNQASEELRFEEAALYRDRVEVLENFKAGKDIISYRSENRDVFGLYREGSLAAISILHVRDGRILNNENFPLNEVIGSDEEILESVLQQYYERADVPNEIIIPLEIESEKVLIDQIEKAREARPKIISAKRGIKRRLLGISELNARQAFKEKFNAEDRYSAIAKDLYKKFSLSQVPRRIECLDISNLQGSNIVAAIVTFQDGFPDKGSYKKFKLPFSEKPDDFKAMYEVVLRRLVRGIEDENLPDLLIIDGGMGQLNAALKARDEIGYNIDMISLAKSRAVNNEDGESVLKPERVFLPYKEDSIPLVSTDPTTQFLERVRDETHRFVITFHRTQRAKRVFKSILDEIPGIGEERRKKLLKEFGSVDRVRSSSIEEISKLGKLPLSLAQRIKEALEK